MARRAMALREHARAMALAYHAPKDIDQLIQPPDLATADSRFETEIWWPTGKE